MIEFAPDARLYIRVERNWILWRLNKADMDSVCNRMEMLE